MISVVVPVYNTGPILAECIDSILDSTYRDFELILVDDGSTDVSPVLCREYCRKDGRVRLIEQENQGASVARNRGIESSRGEWVVFVDSDDVVLPDFLGMVAAEETADLLIFDYTGIHATERTEAARRIPVSLDGPEDRADLVGRVLRFRQLADGGHADLRAPWAKAYRRSVLERHSIRFASGVRVGEDVLFNVEFILAARSCVYFSVPVYCHRIWMGSISHRFVTDLSDSFYILQRRLFDVLAVHGMFPLLERAYAAKTLENMAYLLIKGIFNPYSPNTVREERELCGRMREDEIYDAALKYNSGIGRLSRRILLGLFGLRCYRMVKTICRLCFRVIELMDERRAKRPVQQDV